MKLMTLLSVCVLTLTLFSCTKTNDNTVTVVGYMHQASDSLPMKSTSFLLHQETPKTYIQKGEEVTMPFSTDENGYFTVSFEAVSAFGAGLYFCHPDAHDCKDQRWGVGVEAPTSNFQDYGILYMPDHL